MLTRRTALLTTLAASACTTLPSGPPLDAQFTNIETPSESVHSGVSSEDGEQRLTVRLCRYPQLGLAWLWVHVRVDGQFYSFVDHMAPCGTDASKVDGDSVRYADAAETLVFERFGKVGAPTSATFNGKCRAHRSATSRFGAGDTPLTASITFNPKRLYAGLNRGRTEVFGTGTATIVVNGKTHTFTGPAQFHEQGQTNPRFTAPFCYMSFWNAEAASTMLIAPRRREGYLLEGDKATEVTSVFVDPPAPNRAISVTLADGRKLAGEAVVVQPYTLPLVGNIWRGHMVNVELAGRQFHGQLNDYIIGDGVPYRGAILPASG